MATAIDPICKMDVDTANPPGGLSEYQGGTYYFCAPGCKVAFDREPEKYLQSAGQPPTQQRVSFISRIFGRK